MKSNMEETQRINRDLPAHSVVSDYQVEFDIGNGSCYLWCCWGAASYGLGFLCFCIANKLMNSQEVIFEDKRLNYKSDCWLLRQDKMVPYDRIQDVNITENCCQRCWGVHDVSIQTAGGGERPEVVIIAPKNPHALRDHIIAHRDQIVHNMAGSHRDDGTGSTSLSPLLQSTGKASTANKESEMVEVNATLLRIEKLMEQGLNKVLV